MSAARKLTAVPAAPVAKPRLKRVTLAWAMKLHPNPVHARRLLAAVTTLRTKTKRGWWVDNHAPRKEA